jgi:hypothetical protein
MKRAFAILASTSLVVVVGCSDYELRLQETLAEMKYQKKVAAKLGDAPTKGPLQTNQIYVRPPKGLQGPTQAFSLTVSEPGKFDIENSFIDQEKQSSLHVVARVKKPKGPPDAKKGAAPAAEVTPRGKFVSDVIDLVKAAYNVELPPSGLKDEIKSHARRTYNYKAARMDLGNKEAQLYIYGADENNVHQVALIFEYPKTEAENLSEKIALCLENLAVGERAANLFSGAGDVEGGEEAGGTGAPPI